MHIFHLFSCALEENAYICGGLGEKSRAADALAYYFALTEKTSEISSGIVRFKKQREMPKEGYSLTSI